MSNSPQRSFAAGEVAPALYAHSDQAKYGTGLRQCRNFMVLKWGGVANRPGSQWIHEAKDSTQAVRLAKFVFENVGVSNTYVLEMGNQTLRFIQAGAVVVTSGVSAWVTATAYTAADLVTQGGTTYYCTLAHTSGATTQPGIGASWQTNWYALTTTNGVTPYEIPTPYLSTDLPDVKYVQSKDVITLVHPSYPPQELKRFGHTRWTLTPIVFGPAIGSPTSLSVSGGLAGPKQFYWAVTAIDGITSEESLPTIIGSTTHVPDSGTATTISWALVPSADSYNLYRSTDGVSYGYIGTTGGTPNAATDASWTTSSNTETTSTTGAWTQSAGQARNPVVAAATDKATDGNYHVFASITVTASSLGGTPTQTLGRIRAFYSRDAETRVDAGIVVGPYIVNGASSFGPIPFNATLNVPDNGYSALTIDLVPEVLGNGSGLNSYQCTADATAGHIDWTKGGTAFNDLNVAPNMAEAPPAQPVLFASANNYPATVGYYQGRQLFGNTGTDPERVWASRSASFKSFTSSTPLQDDDSISFRMAGQRLNSIRHFVDLYGRELVFTTEGEWTLEGDQAGTLLPTAINPRQQTASGSGRLPPLVVISTLLFLQARGSIVRDLKRATWAYTLYNNSDLTIYASHLFDGYSVADWDYAQIPHSVVWAVRSDGTLLGLTYIPEQDVWGWHRHDTDGVYENVCCVPEGNEDAVYVVVRRTIGGVSKRYVERFASRAITQLTDVRDLRFMDAWLAYDGRNTTAETMTLSGGTAWDETETLTVTRSVGSFVAGDAGTTAIQLTAADGTQLRVSLTGYTSTTVMTGVANRIVPVDLRSTATTLWARAAQIIANITHLEGKAVSVYADAYVESSPNNSDYPTLTVTGGIVTLSQPRAVVYVGLPYISDLETLDIDTPSGPSLKEGMRNVSRLGAFVQDTRGLFAGPAPNSGPHGPTATAPLAGLQEFKLRDSVSGYGPTDLVTNFKPVSIDATWNDHGRVFVRQVDPLPATILSLTPIGKL